MKSLYKSPKWVVSLIFFIATGAPTDGAQLRYLTSRPWATNVIVPQVRSYVMGYQSGVIITGIRAGAVISRQMATTTLEISLANRSRILQESELLVPVPEGTVVRSFVFQGQKAEPCLDLLPKDSAAGTYRSLVAKTRDPALLEFAGYSLLRSSVFPVEAGGTQTVRLTYENLLTADGNRIDYVLPRSESLEYAVPWKVSIRIKAKAPIQAVYSPTHKIQTVTRSENIVSVRVVDEGRMEPGPLRISYLLRQDDVTASFLAYPDPKIGGGYFLLLAGLPDEGIHRKAPTVKREVTLVIDRSGSMRGGKMDQVKKAAKNILDRLKPGEAFNLIAYNESVESFNPQPLILSPNTRASTQLWIDNLNPNGGTNIYDALNEALHPEPIKGLLPQVLFLTDGLPTVGRTSEAAIREMAVSTGSYGRRIFTFGVGTDVNTPLLSWLADNTGGAASFVLDSRDLEHKINRTSRRLAGPVMTNPRIRVLDRNGYEASGAVCDILPQLRDLFRGDQIVVLGIYRVNQPLIFELSGNLYGRNRTFRFTFHPDSASTRHSYVPRLWASRKIGFLSEAIRQTHLQSTDPRVRELVNEVVRLSTEFGVMTEHTSFLAFEGTDLSRPDAIMREAVSNFVNRSFRVRSGNGSVNQEINNDFLKNQTTMNSVNFHIDQNLNPVIITSVRQVSDRTFYLKNNQWVDSNLVSHASAFKPSCVIHFGSKKYFDLAARLASQGRQGILALEGDILTVLDGHSILITGAAHQ
jgi:Ca-activated chloride channel family protein